MKPEAIASDLLTQLGAQIRERIGLHYTAERLGDLERGVRGAARDFGFQGESAGAQCARWLLEAPLTAAQIDTLARHLTIGETYFFRDPGVFEALRQRILPEVLRQRAARGEKMLRIWSAACCTGEEPYSVAMLLTQALPVLLVDWRDWRVEILATDLNPHFLEKARGGIYGAWSFRDGGQEEQRQFFTKTADGRFQIKPAVQRLVRFAQLNLMSGDFPSSLNGTAGQDIIFCRNVLMYFTKEQARPVVEKLTRCLTENGFLVPSASEASAQLFAPLVSEHWPGAIIYQRGAAPEAPAVMPAPAPTMPRRTPEKPAAPRRVPARSAVPSMTPSTPPVEDAATWHARARGRADEGQLDEALRLCDQAIAADKMHASHHYLRASILMERGEDAQAEQSLRRAIYLEPDFAIAHFALGSLARRRGDHAAARKAFTVALRLLAQSDSQAPVPEASGLSAGHLAETIAHALEALGKT